MNGQTKSNLPTNEKRDNADAAAVRSTAAAKTTPHTIAVVVRYPWGVRRALIAPSEDDGTSRLRSQHRQGHAPREWVIVRWLDKESESS